MYIKEIYLNNFRLLKNNKIEFSKKFNLIYGKNAMGKTSLIEAIYFLASGKSFRTRKLTEQILDNEKSLTVFGVVSNKIDTRYAVKLTKDKRNFFIENENTLYKDYVGKIGIVSFSPEDIELITGMPDNRRRFFNYEMSQIDFKTLQTLITFQKVLKVRNKLIKENKVKDELFNIYNQKYIELSVDILLKRNEYILNIEKLMSQKYFDLFGKRKEIKLKYNSFMEIRTKDEKELQKTFEKILAQKLDKEVLYGYSLVGPQKDDFIFMLDDKNAKSYASQGEKKSILLALKLAIIEKYTNENKTMPIFLFDDVEAYFDEFRKSNIISYLENKEIQCFFTSTKKIFENSNSIKIENGERVNGS